MAHRLSFNKFWSDICIRSISDNAWPFEFYIKNSFIFVAYRHPVLKLPFRMAKFKRPRIWYFISVNPNWYLIFCLNRYPIFYRYSDVWYLFICRYPISCVSRYPIFILVKCHPIPISDIWKKKQQLMYRQIRYISLPIFTLLKSHLLW